MASSSDKRMKDRRGADRRQDKKPVAFPDRREGQRRTGDDRRAKQRTQIS